MSYSTTRLVIAHASDFMVRHAVRRTVRITYGGGGGGVIVTTLNYIIHKKRQKFSVKQCISV